MIGLRIIDGSDDFTFLQSAVRRIDIRVIDDVRMIDGLDD